MVSPVLDKSKVLNNSSRSRLLCNFMEDTRFLPGLMESYTPHQQGLHLYFINTQDVLHHRFPTED